MRRPLVCALIALIAATFFSAAFTHNSWISRNRLKNAAGEWCCGEGDCFVQATVKQTRAGYLLTNGELIPYPEAQPSPDGTFVRCQRPDGSRRCFFAPPPNT